MKSLEFNNVKIAVIGCGWLGFPLAKSLFEKGAFVLGTTTTETKLLDLEFNNIKGIFWSLEENKLQKIDFLSNFDVIIINIPPSKVKENKSYSFLLGLFAKCISESSKVIFVSTTSVYPDSLYEATEDYSWSREDIIKETVLAEIELSKNLSERLTILRLAGLIGPNRHPVRFLAGKENLPNGNSPVNLIQLDDVVGLIERIIKDKYWGEIVNGCFPSHPTRKEYYQSAAIKLNLTMPLFQESSETGKLVNSEKSISHLNYNYSKSIFDLE